MSIESIKARLEAATEGPWDHQPDLRRRCEGCGDRVCVGVAVIECPRCGGRLVDDGGEDAV